MRPEEVIARVFGVAVGSVTEDTSNETLEAWDSFGHVTLVLELEAAYGVQLSADDALVMTDVSAVKRTLQARGARW